MSMSFRTLLMTATLALAAVLLAPATSAEAATLDAPAPLLRCQGDLHTVQLICFHETPKEYASCYLFDNGPLLWTQCL